MIAALKIRGVRAVSIVVAAKHMTLRLEKPPVSNDECFVFGLIVMAILFAIPIWLLTKKEAPK
jgi:hypothetical protein